MNNLAVKYFQKALELNEKGRHLKAIEAYKLSLRHNPNFVEALTNLGLMLNNSKRPKEALQFLLKANKLRPNNIIIQNNIGVSKMQLGLNNDALNIFNCILEEKPHNLEANLNSIILTSRMLDNDGFRKKKKFISKIVSDEILIDLLAINEVFERQDSDLYTQLELAITNQIDYWVNNNIAPEKIFSSLTSIPEIQPLITLLTVAQQKSRNRFLKSFTDSFDSYLMNFPEYLLIKAKYLLSNEDCDLKLVEALLDKAKSYSLNEEELISVDCELAYWSGDHSR